MTNKELFRDMLKSRRKGMGAGNRAKTKKYKPKQQWLYPYQWERKYEKEIRTLQRQFTIPLTKALDKNLDRWIQEYNADRSDSDEIREDAFGAELRALIEAEQAHLIEIYGPENAPVVRAMITDIGDGVSAWNLKQFGKFTKDILGVEFFTTEPWETEVIETWSDTNFELIKSLSTEYIKTANTIVSEGVQFGKTANEIMKEIRATNKQITGWRARLIARDQVGKLNGALTKRRMEDAGIDMYTWNTAGDERVRGNPSGPFKNAVPSHYVMSNKLCRWDDNTVYSEDGGNTWKKRTGKMPKAIPGQEIQCRCSALPFFDDMIEEIDEEIKKETA